MGLAKTIEQAELMTVTFKNEGKMYAQEQLKSRDQKLYMAMLIGNHYKNNVRILFNTEDGEKELSSRIWATTEKFVVLKGGLFLPISSIIDVFID